MADLRLMRVMIVGHDAAELETMCAVLSRAGYGPPATAHLPVDVDALRTAANPDIVVLGLPPGSPPEPYLRELRDLTDEPDCLPIVVVTDSDPVARREAVAHGARDVIVRPVDQSELLLRVRNALQARRLERELNDRSAALADAVRKRTAELEMTRLESLSVVASMAEYHDDDTYQHTQRVGLSAALIARALGLSGELVSNIRDAAPLHDIGKVGISRRILLKPGELTPAEWTHMTRHVEIGARILASARSPVLRLAADIARTHHERWDGRGYLAGLAGEEIPLAGRITAVADVFDVLTHERPYNRAWPRERAVAEVQKQAGTQFDPVVVAAFITIDLQAWAELLADHETAQAA